MSRRRMHDPAEIFETARQLTNDAERRRFLDDACGTNRALRARVEGLLRAATEADAFFDETTHAVREAIEALQATGGLQGLDPSLGAYLPGEEPVGTRIGRYKLLKKIGEGGCGVVYEAEQEEPVRRHVALKIIKLGMETKSVIARFEAERQALAMMDHPNIAHVFDAGATLRGPPYFVMELVRGVKITEYCDQNRLDTTQRLELFVQICHAIQHAHQKGVVHGDIKPSNILVTMNDGAPLPKVIDFGISKATEARLEEKLFVTNDGQLIGTPAYMSPEQAEMGAMDIDTRSDIYSLGVLLYELLTGSTPFEPKQLSSGGLEGLRRTFRDIDPVRPSARLKLLPDEQLEAVAATRRADVPRLIARSRGDLDWIVMKALEKDRRRRYETANGLAVDIQRHLGNEPVVARPPSRLYRFEKLVRRNRGVFVAAGAVALSLILGMATSTWLFLRERDARTRAVAAERQEARLREEAELRQKVTQAALLVSLEKFPQADTIVSELRIVQPTLEGAAVFRALGEWHVMEHRWKPAAARFGVLLHIDQLDGWDVATLDVLRQGPALINSGDVAGYERFRQDAVARYPENAQPAGDRVLKICLLAPADDKLLNLLKVYAEGARKSFVAAEAGNDAFSAAWRAMSLALWEYRRGEYSRAVEWAERCLATSDTNPPRTATAQVILALAENRLGRTDEATAHLREAERMVAAREHAPANRGTPVLGFWFDWEFARVLLREAQAPVRAGGAGR